MSTVTDVFVTDDGMSYEAAELHFEKLADWARENCPGFVTYHVQDVADFSPVNDLIARYRFTSDHDVMWFKLRWE